MKYITKGNANPQGKPKIYFTGHPKDCGLYFENIRDMIFKQHNCAIFYDENSEHPDDMDNFMSDLERMQLIVIVVTSRYVYGKNLFAHNVVFRHAMEKHIPVLPILEEPGIERDFDKKCGNLQFLNPHSKDSTEIGFEEKLKKFLDSVLIGDEMAEKIRAAFDAYVFLSYRKKDRRYAQELMKLIHSNDFCRDIAIWYDEFLVPGENFNDAIAKAMEKSELFAMVVTPSLLEKPNYVMSTEYPAAREAGKKIIPAVLVPTKESKLKKYYKDIPDAIDHEDTNALAVALKKALENISVRKNDEDPQHMFFIGLAYLSGIDVEIEYERAVNLITEAAEKELPEAIDKLVSMYRNGDGVARNYETAIEWLKKLVAIREKEFEQEQTEKRALDWTDELLRLGSYIQQIGHNKEAKEIFLQISSVSLKMNSIFMNDWAKLGAISSGRALGNACIKLGESENAKTVYEACIDLGECIIKQRRTVGMMIELARCYDCLGHIYSEQGGLKEALDLHKKGLSTRESIASHTGTDESQHELSASYSNIGKIYIQQNDLEVAKAYYEKSLVIDKRLAEQNDDPYLQFSLSITYNNLGAVYKKQGDSTTAKVFFEKAMSICERLIEQIGDTFHLETLNSIYHNLGAECEKQGALEDAKTYYEKGLVISQRLTDQTDAIKTKKNLAVNYSNLGNICKKQGDLQSAKSYFLKCLSIREKLASDSSDSQKELAASYEKLGDICKMQKDFSASQGYLDALIRTRKRIVEARSTDKAYDALAKAYLLRGSSEQVFKNSLPYLRQSESIWAMLVKQFPQNTEYAEMLKKIQDILY